MPRVVHFEIQAAEPERAITFYSTLFRWEFERWSEQEYWLITTGPDTEMGINGGLLPRRGIIDGQAVIAYVCTIDVDDLDRYMEQAAALGGHVVVPKMTIPGVGWLGYVKDTEGNIFGMMQNSPNAV